MNSPTKTIDLGDGSLPVCHIRRRGHDDPYLLLLHELTEVVKIINRPPGITIVCRLHLISTTVKYEHFEIWYSVNAKLKLREYFAGRSVRHQRRISQGRMRSLYQTAMGGSVDQVLRRGTLMPPRPLPLYRPSSTASPGDKDGTVIPSELLQMIPIEELQSLISLPEFSEAMCKFDKMSEGLRCLRDRDDRDHRECRRD